MLKEKCIVCLKEFSKIKGNTCKKCTFKVCPVCNSNHQKTSISCSKECRYELVKITCIKRYGVINVFAVESVKEKMKKDSLEKYGVEFPQQSLIAKEKMKELCMEKYGVTSVLAAEHIKEKIRNTLQQKYGVDNPYQIKEVKEKILKISNEKRSETIEKTKQTNIEKYGVSCIFQLDTIKEKIKKSMNEIHGVDNGFKMKSAREKCNSPEAHIKKRKTMSANKTWKGSSPENQLYDILNKKYVTVERQISVNGWLMDFYVPCIDTFFNMNGVYWHGRDKNIQILLETKNPRNKSIAGTIIRDQKKTEWFKDNNKKLIIVWEDEFDKIDEILP